MIAFLLTSYLAQMSMALYKLGKITELKACVEQVASYFEQPFFCQLKSMRFFFRIWQAI